MAFDDLELSLMAFPQSWTGGTLTVRVLVLPVGNPLGAVGSVPKFAGTTLKLKAVVLSGDALPTTATALVMSVPFEAVPPPATVAILSSLQARLNPGTTVTSGKVTAAPPDTALIMKALPDSYTTAFAFERPLDDRFFVVGDGYGCAVQAQDPGLKQPDPPKTIAWGQLLSYLLRQPVLAQAVGLWYETTLTIPAAAVKDGGWVYFALDTSNPANPFVSDFTKPVTGPDTVKSYAGRLPPLTTNRNLFAAALFPIVAAPSSKLAEAQLEAETYDDGFAQIVHCHQPRTLDAGTGDNGGIAPGAEAGMQIAWDDEQITVWLNRQIDLLRERVKNVAVPTLESPLGVQGYRVDVREVTTPASGWQSLCAVTGNLPFSADAADGSGFTRPGEQFVTPAPIRPLPAMPGANPEPAWLPLYFAQWRGASLVVHDDTMTTITPRAAAAKPMPSSALQAVPVAPPLYGQDYQFRVRFVDLTGGGPEANDDPIHPGLAPVGTCPFRRFIPPKSLEVASTPPIPVAPPQPDGSATIAKPEATRTITQLSVRKPRLGYPEALFAGVSPAIFNGASLDALIADAAASGRGLGVPDPDVDRFRVLVEARIPAHDTGTQGTLPGDLDGATWRIVYSAEQHFPPGDDPEIVLSFDYQEAADILTMPTPTDDETTLPAPTARDVRIRLIPLCQQKSDYYGTPQPPEGLPTDFVTRKNATIEDALTPFDPPHQLKACWFQHGHDLPQLLAQSLGLVAQGLTISDKPGRRTVFAASGGLRCTLAPDGSSITLANESELLDHWIVALVIDLNRDWTWDGFASPAITVRRDGKVIGSVLYPRVVGAIALGELQHPADRAMSRVVFLDAISPMPGPGGFPTVLNPSYGFTASFPSASALTQTYDSGTTPLKLPITTRPRQTMSVVSTGIAESPFTHSPTYSSTGLRDRYLWVEFDNKIIDTADDTIFGRVVSYGPDPLLSQALVPPLTVPVVDPEPPLAIDPEPVRLIFAGQGRDDSGLDAMTPLIPATSSGVHWLLPLPPGITAEALELFGFWTYEFRLGHAKFWSTAQGRFGRPLRVTGVQHPAPHLTCAVNRTEQKITVSAPFATTVLNGERVYDLRHGDPQTALWFLLYAQVMQMDGQAWRNVLLTRKEASLMMPTDEKKIAKKHAPNREPRGGVIFAEAEIDKMLGILHLPRNSPLSVLAVEVLPGPLRREAVTHHAEDPLGRQLGLRRILRTSPLTEVPAVC